MSFLEISKDEANLDNELIVFLRNFAGCPQVFLGTLHRKEFCRFLSKEHREIIIAETYWKHWFKISGKPEICVSCLEWILAHRGFIPSNCQGGSGMLIPRTMENQLSEFVKMRGGVIIKEEKYHQPSIEINLETSSRFT
jgi:hypothetical protein